MATKLQQDLGNIPTIKSEYDVHTGADLAFKPEVLLVRVPLCRQ